MSLSAWDPLKNSIKIAINLFNILFSLSKVYAPMFKNLTPRKAEYLNFYKIFENFQEI